ncbi:MAG: hypothetical protein HYW23_04290 [Candidatus Aenigmarchaeota archaeon]|nr:hypothetical protein [Candidatus Aenigmarchaeota archaeon]
MDPKLTKRDLIKLGGTLGVALFVLPSMEKLTSASDAVTRSIQSLAARRHAITQQQASSRVHTEGATKFIIDDSWDEGEQNELHYIIRRAYEPLRSVFGTEPLDRNYKTGVEVRIVKGGLPENERGRTIFDGDKTRTILLRDTSHNVFVHEESHVFQGNSIIAADTYQEGLPEGTSLIVGRQIGEDYRDARRYQYKLTNVNPYLFNKEKLATLDKFDNNLLLRTIRQFLIGEAFAYLYDEDRDFIGTFTENYRKASERTVFDFSDASNIAKFQDLVRKSCRINFDEYTSRWLILKFPSDGTLKKYVAIVPVDVPFFRQEFLGIVTYAHQLGIEDPWSGQRVDVSIVDKGGYGVNYVSYTTRDYGLAPPYLKPIHGKSYGAVATFTNGVKETDADAVDLN